MNLPAALLAIRWLVRDTFSQAAASRILHLMLGVSFLAVLFCLSVGTSDLPLKPRDANMPSVDSRRMTRSISDARGAARAVGTPGMARIGRTPA